MGIYVEIVWADGRREIIDSHLDTLDDVDLLWVTTFKADLGLALSERIKTVVQEKHMFRRSCLGSDFYEVTK